MKTIRLICGALFTVAWVYLPFCAVSAPVRPEGAQAGVADRGFEPRVRTATVEKAVPEIPEEAAPEAAAAPAGGKKFLVKEFKFEGNAVYSSKTLALLVADHLGKEADIRVLNRACGAVTQFYRQHGYLMVRAELPEQEVKDGVVTIRVREVPISKVTVTGNKAYSERFIMRQFQGIEKRPIRYDDLLRRLLLINEYSNLQVRAFFSKGAEEWTTDLGLQVEDKRPLRLLVDYNNYGSRYVSRSRERATLDYGNIFTDGDLFTGSVIAGMPLDSMDNYLVQYKIPVNTEGTKLAVSYNYSNFTVGKEFEDLDIKGDYQDAALTLTHPWYRSRRTSVDVFGRFDYKVAKNDMLGEQMSEDQLRVLSAGASLDMVDRWNGRNFLNLELDQAVPGFMGSDKADNPDASRAGAGGEFTKGLLSYNRLQKMPWDSLLVLKGTGQVASVDLPASEQFSLGGYETVRGYMQAKYLGDDGYTLSAELRFLPPFMAGWNVPRLHKPMDQFMQFNVFFDYGAVMLKTALAGEKKTRDLMGTGVGVRFMLPRDINLNLAWAFPVNKEDDTDDSSVGYLYVAKQFF